MGVFFLFPGHSKRPILGDNVCDHHASHMAIHALLNELDLHYEFHHSVSILTRAMGCSVDRAVKR